jgi:hypothetical protein
MMRLVQIPSEAVAQAWPLIGGWIKDATERSGGRFSQDAIFEELRQERQQLWIVWDGEKNKAMAAGVSQLIVYPTGLKVADVIILTGESRQAWKHLVGKFEEWATSENCGVVQIFARRGWARDLTDYKMSHVLLEKKL